MKLTGNINGDAIDIAVYFNGYDGIRRVESIEYDVDTLQSAVANLTANVYTKSQTYSKTEVNNAIQVAEEQLHDEITDLGTTIRNLEDADIACTVQGYESTVFDAITLIDHQLQNQYTKTQVDTKLAEEAAQRQSLANDLQDAVDEADSAIGELQNEMPNKANRSEVPSLAFRELAVTMGAVWNASTGFFELNGLTDITEAQMRTIIRYTANYRPQNDLNSALRGKNANGTIVGFRTNICNHAYIFGTTGNLSTSMWYFANNNQQLEVVKLTAGNETSEQIWATTLQFAFNNCKELRQIIGVINVGKITANGQLANSFTNCLKLESVSIYNLGASLSLADSPNLTAASVATMVANAQENVELTITLNDVAHTRARTDADVIAASDTRPMVTIINATGNHKIVAGNMWYSPDGGQTWQREMY